MTNHTLQSEVKRRKTFAIISHPDAGKTTVTEKLLYLGGAIRAAGTVKGRKSQRFATSDWMEIEKQRGISITTSVMQFNYDDHHIIILDTPGHEDFSEDTYRTLMAVDSVLMIIDAAKGVEAQTKKLFKVCRDRGIPIFTFINKMDRQGKEPLDLLAEIEDVLSIDSYPMNWPIGMGNSFRGVYDRQNKTIELYNDEHDMMRYDVKNEQLSEELSQYIDDSEWEQLQMDVALLTEAGNSYSDESVQAGTLTPVFFGSAISSFGLPSLLDHFLTLAPSPTPRNSDQGMIDPTSEQFSGFIFKIQANMNPAHRDRIAFMRICSGTFTGGMNAWLDRTNKAVKLAQPQQFFSSERQQVNEAYAGDIIGLYDPGVYQIGDTLCESKQTFSFDPMPQFPPEHFAKVRAKNAMKQKHFYKGVNQLSEEGAVQVYYTEMEEIILGVVGNLQFEIFEHRLKGEYGVDVDMQRVSYSIARWFEENSLDDINLKQYRDMLVYTKEKRPVILFENEFALRWFQDKNPDVQLSAVPFKTRQLLDKQSAGN